MRKLILQVQITVNGYVGGPNGELDWMTWDWDDGIKTYVNDLTDSIDTILLGRKMTDGFVSYWRNAVADPKNPEYDFARKMTDTPKIVFTKMLEKSAWDNTSIAKGNLTDEVNNLKNREGKDMIVYGGASFVSSLIKEGLIDEYYLFVNPASIGRGMTIFSGLDITKYFNLKNTKAFDCGIVVLRYVPK